MIYRLCFLWGLHSLAIAGWQPTNLSMQSSVGAAAGCDLLILLLKRSQPSAAPTGNGMAGEAGRLSGRLREQALLLRKSKAEHPVLLTTQQDER
jgi:hypothetical protein